MSDKEEVLRKSLPGAPNVRSKKRKLNLGDKRKTPAFAKRISKIQTTVWAKRLADK